MDENSHKSNDFMDSFKNLYNLKVLVSIALLSAISIICGKFLAIPGGNVLRFSFENLPIILSSFAFGPIAGMITGVVADLIGCVMVGYTINPIVTLGAASIGLMSGLSYIILKKLPLPVRVLLSVFIAHITGSVIIKTIGLSKFYEMPFFTLLLWRLLNYVIVGSLEFVLLYYIMRSKAISTQLERLKR